MKINEAINTAVRAFYDGKSPVKLTEAKGNVKYTKEFFDNLEDDIVPKSAKEKKKNKKEAIEDVKEDSDGFI